MPRIPALTNVGSNGIRNRGSKWRGKEQLSQALSSAAFQCRAKQVREHVAPASFLRRPTCTPISGRVVYSKYHPRQADDPNECRCACVEHKASNEIAQEERGDCNHRGIWFKAGVVIHSRHKRLGQEADEHGTNNGYKVMCNQSKRP